MSEVDQAAFWDGKYDRKEDGWDLGVPAPPLVRLLRETPPPKGRVAVPGCGRGHDVGLWTSLGYDATGFDFSSRAVAGAERLGHRVLERDVFGLAKDFRGRFDLVWEYTCFCAIDPARREEYLDMVVGILKPGGELIALFYPVDKEAPGPPFTVKRAELDAMLLERFDLLSVETPADSLERRRGHELLVRARRRR